MGDTFDFFGLARDFLARRPRTGLAGPVVCTMPGSATAEGQAGVGQINELTSQALAEAHASAALLIEDGDADAALVIAANAFLGGASFGTAELVGPSWWTSA